MDSIAPYSNEKQQATVIAGFKGGPFFMSPNLAPKITIDQSGYPDSLNQSLSSNNGVAPTKPFDPWVNRRPNSSMK